MKKIDTTYTIKVTIEEVNTITEALHKAYKEAKTLLLSEDATELRELRNSFANLCNRSYMGEDA